MNIKLKRMWVNQPSTLQPLHKYHGTNVLAETVNNKLTGIVYLLTGDTHSMDIPTNQPVLSEGWLDKPTAMQVFVYAFITDDSDIGSIVVEATSRTKAEEELHKSWIADYTECRPIPEMELLYQHTKC
jgi:hypothetical protein